MTARWTTVLCVALFACSTNNGTAPPVTDGVCDIGSNADPAELVIASVGSACPSHTCLKVPLSNPNPPAGFVYPGPSEGLCTASCQVDADCAPESSCVSGFTCGVPPDLTIGPDCCEKLCICKDYVVVPGAGLPVPAACDPSNANNGCCNLPGRAGSYPGC